MTQKCLFKRSKPIWIGSALLHVVSVLCAQDLAPPSPARQWNPPRLQAAEKELAQSTAVYANCPVTNVDPAKVYTLPELIDIAECNNPQIRSAWESARSKAAGVGLSKSLYYPLLAAAASSKFSRMFIPFPQLQVDKQALQSALGGLTGGTGSTGGTSSSDGGAIVSIAGGSSLVSKTSTSEAELRAEQQDAQAELDVLTSRAKLNDELVTLINGLGIPPTTALQVAGMPNLRLSSQIVPALDALIDRALSHRPDLVSSLADVRAARAGVRKVRAEYYPTVTFSASGDYSNLASSSGGGPYIDAHDYDYSATLKVDWLLFDGFARDNQMREAKAKLRSAEAKLAQSRDDAVKEVWQNYTDLRSSFEQRDASARSLKAAEAAFDVTLRYYEQGLSTYPDVVDAEKSVASSRSNDVEIRTQLFTRAAALAHSVGDIDRLAPPARTPLPPKLARPSPAPTAKPTQSPAPRRAGVPKK